MSIDNKIGYEKLQHDINREAAKISALSSGKIDKFKFLTDEEILLPDHRRMIEQTKFTYSPLGKVTDNPSVRIYINQIETELHLR